MNNATRPNPPQTKFDNPTAALGQAVSPLGTKYPLRITVINGSSWVEAVVYDRP